MSAADPFVATLRGLLNDAERLLADGDRALCEAEDELSATRREHTAAKRAVKTLSAGTTALQAIGQTVAEQIERLAEAVEQKASEVAVQRTRRRNLAKAVDNLRAALEEQQPPNDALVRPMVAKLVEENDGLTYEEVYALVSDKLIADSQPRIGLGLQVRRVLVALRYEADDAGVYHAKGGAVTGAAGATPSRPRSELPAGSERRGHPIPLEPTRQ